MIFLLAFAADTDTDCLDKTGAYLKLKGHHTIKVSSNTLTGKILTGFLNPEVDGIIGNVCGCDCTITTKEIHSGVYKANIDSFIDRLVNDINLGTQKEYLRVCQSLYTTYLAKSRDYGSAALKLTGISGILTRSWDKMARLLHLSGYRYQLTVLPNEPPKPPNNESVKDTWLDLASYCILALINLPNPAPTMTEAELKAKLDLPPSLMGEGEYNQIRNVVLFRIAVDEGMDYYQLVELFDRWYKGENVQIF